MFPPMLEGPEPPQNRPPKDHARCFVLKLRGARGETQEEGEDDGIIIIILYVINIYIYMKKR